MSILAGIDPAIDKYAERDFPIEPDFLGGWKIKLKGFRQISVRYLYPPVDQIVREYTQLKQAHIYRVVYLGPRHNTNLKTIRAYCQKEYDSRLKESLLYEQEQMMKYQYSRHKEKDLVSGLEQLGNRIFVGMNPTVLSDDELHFDSDFECGNLDMAMKVDVNQYDIFMRVDSNTKGHTSWYFFKTKNTRKGSKVKLNICNFHKKSSLYNKGMKPYVWSRVSGRGWVQANVETTYEKKSLRYKESRQHTKPLYCLSFVYEFQNDYDQVYFCYGIPYSYSYLMKFIESLMKNPEHKHIIRYDKKYQSASGLTIPVLTITNPNFLVKKVVLITGRLHPGETQGSWVLHGFINFLCSPEAEELRNLAMFKIIPMVNVDGVIAGNFRTSLRGADLNRKFRTDSVSLLKDDEVGWVKNLAYQYSKNIHTYLDFHGHSTSKNAFIYGPQYPMNHQHYLSSRLFPKLISKGTEMFRYHSCNFRISQTKQTTARAIMFKENKVPFCFTIETSNHSYHSHQNGECVFSRQLFIELGGIIGSKQQEFMTLMNEIDLKKEEMRLLRKKKVSDKKQTKMNFFSNKTMKMEIKKTAKEKAFVEVDNAFSLEEFLEDMYNRHNLGGIKEEIELEKLEVSKPREEALSESSDYESETEDYTEQELMSMFHMKKDNKSASPEVAAIKGPKSKGKKRSASYRLPPPEPPKHFISRKHQPQQYKMSPRTISISSHNSQLFGGRGFLIEKQKGKQKSHRIRDLAPSSRSKPKIPSIRKIDHIQSQKSRQLRSQNISVQIKDHLTKIQEQKNQVFIYKHVKMLVFPQLMKQPVSNKNMKGYQKKLEVFKTNQCHLRKELIEKRGYRKGGARVSAPEVEG